MTTILSSRRVAVSSENVSRNGGTPVAVYRLHDTSKYTNQSLK